MPLDVHATEEEDKLVVLSSLNRLGGCTEEQLLRFLVENALMNQFQFYLALGGLKEAGFIREARHLEGTLLIPRSVEKELQRLSASEEETCRIRGEKGRETLSQLEALGRVKRVDSAAGGELAQVLLADAKNNNRVIHTCDAAMSRAAEKAGVAALNLNDLACALRPMVQMGDLLDVRIVKAGREATQGVGYTPDGTMVVVEGGRDAVGQVLHVQVSSVLQTSAGRMIFAKKV